MDLNTDFDPDFEDGRPLIATVAGWGETDYASDFTDILRSVDLVSHKMPCKLNLSPGPRMAFALNSQNTMKLIRNNISKESRIYI
jgi:hypothetical protein